jgi:hypothetical protein
MDTPSLSGSKILYLCAVAAFLALTSCGGGGSGSQPPPPPPQVTSVTVGPAMIQVQTGTSQLFTAQVNGTGAFNPSLIWSVNGVTGGNSTYGTITTGGEYTAPAAVPPQSASLITATSVEDPSIFGTSGITIYGPPVLTSITPSSAIAGEVLTVDVTFNSNVIETPQMVFSGVGGTNVTMQLQTGNGLTVTVPQPGSGASVLTSNSVPFTRLPNLQVRAPTKDLSSGESLQLDWRLLGASTPNVVSWTADSGSVSAQGLFQAPVVSSESYSRVTGCLQNTNSCNTVLLRILPFRIGPSSPIVNVGNTIQLDAIQGESLLSPQWSVLAGGGSVTSGGLFTAPTTPAQAGPVPIGATAGSTTEQTSVAVAGAFPGLVNRVYDYADFTKYTPPEATFAASIAVSGNRAYVLTLGTPFQVIPSYAAIDVYDITNPDQPVWIDAGEAATNNYPYSLFVYGNTLLSMDSSYVGVYSLTSQVPTLTALLPVSPWEWSMNNGVLYVLPNLNPNMVLTTNPIDLYDVSSGTLVHTHYELPNPSSGSVGQLSGISGNGNIVYVVGLDDINNTPTFTIATYDISQSPPSLLSTVVSTSSEEYHLHVVGNLLFADSQVYDISNVTPTKIKTLPLAIESVWGVEGNSVLATVGSVLNGPPGFVVVDISSPDSPVVHTNVTDLLSWDIYSPGTAT